MGTIAELQRDQMLNAYARGTSYGGNAAVWVQLHIGAPGAAGTANVAAETTRKQATFGSVAATGAISNTAAVEWTLVAATETLTDVTLWTASTAGTYLGQDTLSSSASVTAGDTFRIPIGDLDITLV